MAATTTSASSASEPYASWSTPVWPKAHTLELKHRDAYQDSTGSNALGDQHHPLRASRDGTGRRAGTYGAWEHDANDQPDERDRSELGVLDTLRKQQVAQGWTDERVAQIKQKLKAIEEDGAVTTRADAHALAHGAPTPSETAAQQRDQALTDLFASEDVVLSIREIKALLSDWTKADPELYASMRYVLPTTEKAIKEQKWAGKEEGKPKGDAKADGKTEGQSDDKGKGNAPDGNDKQAAPTQADGHKEGTQDAEEQSQARKSSQQPAKDKPADQKETGQDASSITDPAEHAFFVALKEEMDTMSGLQNNPGLPKDMRHKDGSLQDFRLSRKHAGDAMEIQVDDQFTPDSWIPRSSKLLRLTGKHPLNAEPNMTELFDAGLITPTKLHYVRNHGAVPALTYETYRLEVFSDPPGLLEAASFSMKQLTHDFPAVEIPVTLACDGNRRKEVNMIKKSGGFGWSAAGVSTCLWRGVLVRDLLIACKLADRPASERWYLHYEGADQPSEGRYATSIPLAYAMSMENDVMLAYGINGEPLSPDHGFPLRSIIPGYVGGRCVKWLAKLWVSKEPNMSHYHIWDNRVVPSFVTEKQSMLGKAFFHHPDTACMAQVMQSVICKPAHGQYLPLARKEDGKNPMDEMISVEGYAYHGNGNLVQRVELSLDGGKNWKYCFRRLPEAPLRHGDKFWTWLFWRCDVTLKELANSKEIVDAAKNGQPEHITWNLLGMCNSAWYRVRIEVADDPDTGFPALFARHPVEPGAGESGWMKPSAEEVAQQSASQASSDNAKEFSLEEIERHNKADDAWLILDNKVYDVTSVLTWHPGGATAILNYAGKATVDASTEYASIHDGYANQQRDKLLIGKVSDDGVKALQEDAKRAVKAKEASKKARAGLAVNPFRYAAANLVKRKEVSHDTRVYTFALPKKDDGSHGVLGLPIGKHVQLAFHMSDGVVMRPYTPIRPVLPDEEDGTFDLLIKTYFPDKSPFKPGGSMGNYLDVLEEGEDIDIRGPTGEIGYLGGGKFSINDKEHHFEKINLVAGGTGLTPHWQLIHAILKKPDDKTQVSLVDSNSSFGDVLLFDELKRYSEEHTNQFRLWFTLSHPPTDREWKYGTGHLDAKMLQEHFHAIDGDKVATFLCGPPGLIEKAAIPALKEMGFKDGVTMFGF